MENKEETGKICRSFTQPETECQVDNGKNLLERERQYDVAPLSENSNSGSHVTDDGILHNTGGEWDVGISNKISEELYASLTSEEAVIRTCDQTHNEKMLETAAEEQSKTNEERIHRSKRTRQLGNKVKYAIANDNYSGEDIESLEDHDTQNTSDEERHCFQDTDDEDQEEMSSKKKNSSKFSNEMLKNLTQKLKKFVQTVNLGNKSTMFPKESNEITKDKGKKFKVGSERCIQVSSQTSGLHDSQKVEIEPEKQSDNNTHCKRLSMKNDKSKSKNKPVKQSYSDTSCNNPTVINDRSKSKNDHLICKICHNVFASTKRLRMHIRKKHSSTPARSRAKCSTCGKSFKSVRKLHEHEWEKHIQSDHESRHKCKICGKICNNYDELHKHQKSHIGIHRKHCDICQKKPESLISHKIFFHSVEFLSLCCSVCKGKYSKLCKLTPEENKSIAEASNCATTCNICGRTITKLNPEKDQLEKSDVKGFKYCFDCGVGFDTTFQLKQHELSFSHKLKRQAYQQDVYKCCRRKFTGIEEFKAHVSHEQNGMNYQNQPKEQNSHIKPPDNDSSRTKNECVVEKWYSIIQDCDVPDEMKVEPGNLEGDQTSIIVKLETEVESLCTQSWMDTNSEMVPVKQDVVVKQEADGNLEFIKSEPKCDQNIKMELDDSFKLKTLQIVLTDFRSKGLRSVTEHIKNQNEDSGSDTTVTENEMEDLSTEDINGETLPNKATCPFCKIDLPQYMPIGNHLEDHNFIQMCVFCNMFIPDGDNVLQHIADHHFKNPYQKKLGCAVCARGVINHKERPENVHLQIVKCQNAKRQKPVGMYDRQSVSKCSKCNIEIHKWDDFHNHLSYCDLKFNCLKEKSHICNYCGKYTNEETYNNSAYEISYFRKPEGYRPLECKPMQCPVCMQKCKNAYEVFVHCLFHVSPPYYSCNVCTKTFSIWTFIKNHCTEHGTVCRYCNKEFDSNEETMEHMKHNHSEAMTYVCNVCYFGTSDHNEFKRHMDSHSGEQTGMSKCKFCHMMVSDPVSHYEACVSCVKCFCGKWCSKKGIFQHAKLHKPKEPCPICKGDKLYHELTLKQHIKHAHRRKKEKEKTHLCEYCAKTFTQRGALAFHMNSQHLKKKSFTCETCGKSYLYEQSLVLHIRTHTKERPFRCDICGKAFASMCNLTDHIRIHTGEKPYVCSVCKKAFTKSCNMKKHIKLMHPQITFTSSRPTKV